MSLACFTFCALHASPAQIAKISIEQDDGNSSAPHLKPSNVMCEMNSAVYFRREDSIPLATFRPSPSIVGPMDMPTNTTNCSNRLTVQSRIAHASLAASPSEESRLQTQ